MGVGGITYGGGIVRVTTSEEGRGFSLGKPYQPPPPPPSAGDLVTRGAERGSGCSRKTQSGGSSLVFWAHPGKQQNRPRAGWEFLSGWTVQK